MALASNEALQPQGVAATCSNPVVVIGGGLAGSEAALQLAKRDISVRLYEMRPSVQS